MPELLGVGQALKAQYFFCGQVFAPADPNHLIRKEPPICRSDWEKSLGFFVANAVRNTKPPAPKCGSS
jgi:hypothetical protein